MLVGFLCLLCEADAMSDKTSREDTARDTGGHLCKELSSPLLNTTLSTSIFHENQCKFHIKIERLATPIFVKQVLSDSSCRNTDLQGKTRKRFPHDTHRSC